MTARVSGIVIAPRRRRQLEGLRLPPLSIVVALALGAALPSRAAAAAPAPAPPTAAPAQRWEYRVRVADLARGELEIELTLHGFSGELQLCADMPRGGTGVRGLRAVPGQLLVQDADDGDCWDAEVPARGPLVVRYRYDLAALARSSGDPDLACRAGDSYVFNDEAALLRPEPMPGDGAIEISFELPAGTSVATPWRKLEGAPWRFASTPRQHSAGGYVALGKLKALEEIAVPGGTFGVTLLDEPRRAPDAVLHAWVARAARQVAAFYRGVPEGRVHVVLVPVQGATDPDVFGTTLMRAAPSVVMFLGAAADPASFEGDWMATHELFHVGNPRLAGRVRWVNEGSATYYQDVLRARAGAATPEQIWGDLYDGFHRFCAPAHAVSLQVAGQELRKTHRYMQVYWGGACLFFRADVAIREHSGGARSLDDVLRDLRLRSDKTPLTESEVIAAIDREAGAPIASGHLGETGPIPLDALFARLGIEPTGKDTVRLHDDAPLASVRKQILAPEPAAAR